MANNKYRILAVTLARGGSKSIKNKNITKINGRPLIYYTIKEAKKSKLISRHLVSTDDKKIASVCRKLGVPATTLFGAWTTNEKVRPERDWENRNSDVDDKDFQGLNLEQGALNDMGGNVFARSSAPQQMGLDEMKKAGGRRTRGEGTKKS